MLKYTNRQLLEKKLITDFKKKFYKKLGYYPIVSTKVVEKQNDIPMLSLNELEECFMTCFSEILRKPNALRCKDRYRPIVDIRALFTHFARIMRYTYYGIGVHLGGRHHTSILHYNIIFNNEMETNLAFKNKYNRILSYIKEKYESSNVGISNKMEYQS
jgi:hypothetical protein